jgi:hypothetical protein
MLEQRAAQEGQKGAAFSRIARRVLPRITSLDRPYDRQSWLGAVGRRVAAWCRHFGENVQR